MTRRALLPLALAWLSAGSFVVGAGRAPSAPGPKRPNVLLVVVSDLNVHLGCYGYDVKTPSLDRLAAAGRRFERAYSQCPLSLASRASLLTGWRPEQTGVFVERDRLPSAQTLPQRFHASGYFTARVGPLIGRAAGREAEWDLAEDAPLAKAGEPGEADARIARRAAEILAQRREQPFFVAAAFGGPNTGPVPQPYGALYAPEKIALPRGSAERAGAVPAIAVLPNDRTSRPGLVARPVSEPEAGRRQAIAAYYAYVSFLDAQVGALLAALDRLKLWDDTVVVVLGDQGAYLGDHGELPRHDTLFEDSLRVPLLIAAPGLKQPGVPTSQLAELVDLYPTLIELCGLPSAEGLEGASLVPLLQDPGRPLKTAAFSVVRRVTGWLGRSVRTDRYRYSEWPDGSEELYDHEADPHEYVNLALSPEHAPSLREMKHLLDERYKTPSPPSRPAPLAANAMRTRKRNVLFIIADDMNVHLGCYGYDVKTPFIDRLASLGRRFDRAYCQVPMCSPSRASLMSGWRPEKINVWDNLEPPRKHLGGAVPLQEHFKAHGYFTAHVGKIYHGPFEADFQWDLSEHDPGGSEEVEEEEPGPARRPRRRGTGMTSWWIPTNNRDEDEPDGRRARRVAQLIEEHRNAPFFIAAGFAKPHVRWIAPRKYFDMYPPETIRIPDEPADDWKDIPAIAIEHEAVERPGLFLAGRPGPEDGLRRQAVAAYYATVSFVDAQVGVLLDALDRLKLWDDTVVVLVGDHGFHLGEHGGLWRKDTLFEEAVRAPLIIAAPDVKSRGAATSELAEFLDVYPTLVELCGLPWVEGLEGTSLVPLLEDPARGVQSAAFSFRKARPPQLGRTVRTDRYRYTEWPDGSRELYDHQVDSGERTNLAGGPEHARLVAELKERLYAGYEAALVRR